MVNDVAVGLDSRADLVAWLLEASKPGTSWGSMAADNLRARIALLDAGVAPGTTVYRVDPEAATYAPIWGEGGIGNPTAPARGTATKLPIVPLALGLAAFLFLRRR